MHCPCTSCRCLDPLCTRCCLAAIDHPRTTYACLGGRILRDTYYCHVGQWAHPIELNYTRICSSHIRAEETVIRNASHKTLKNPHSPKGWIPRGHTCNLLCDMEYRHLGRTGLKVSTLSYGAWVSFHNQLDVRNAKEIMKLCFDRGINFFDNAETYADGKAEEVMGDAMKVGVQPQVLHITVLQILVRRAQMYDEGFS